MLKIIVRQLTKETVKNITMFKNKLQIKINYIH